MTRSPRWPSFASVLAFACVAAITYVAYDFGAVSQPTLAFGALCAVSVVVGLYELRNVIVDAVTGAFAAMSRSRAFTLACLHYDAMIQTMRRSYTGWRQRFTTAPGHSWKSCAST